MISSYLEYLCYCQMYYFFIYCFIFTDESLRRASLVALGAPKHVFFQGRTGGATGAPVGQSAPALKTLKKKKTLEY